jgi:GNAT superfamily N-acetyltransferase
MGGAIEASDDPLELEPVSDALPAGFDALRAEALAEGFRQVERLAAEWEAGTTRFDRDGEALLGARLTGVLAGVGGLTTDPVVPGALRMRRFYVRPAFRRIGVGRRLVTALLAGVAGDRSITVNAAPASIAFWERLAFDPDPVGRAYEERSSICAIAPRSG